MGLESDGAAAADEGFGHRVAVGAGDPGVVREVGERGGAPAHERMVVADEKGRRVVEERGDDDVLPVDPAPVVVPHERHLDLAVLQHGPEPGDTGAADGQPHVGMRVPEGGHGLREE